MSATETKEYWFARRFPLGHARKGMAPVHWKGYVVVVGFIAALLLGAAGFAYFNAKDNMAEGVAVFILCAFIGGLWFISVARMRGDPVRTVADYKEERARV